MDTDRGPALLRMVIDTNMPRVRRKMAKSQADIRDGRIFDDRYETDRGRNDRFLKRRFIPIAKRYQKEVALRMVLSSQVQEGQPVGTFSIVMILSSTPRGGLCADP
jgi:hypothetical protein